MYYLGLDISLRQTGWGLLEKTSRITYKASGIIKTKADKQEKGYHSDVLALKFLHDSLIEIFTEYKPQKVAIENSYVNSNPLSSLKLAQARAIGLLTSAQFNLIPKEYQASTIKKIVTGKGNADKEQVHRLLKLQLGPLTVASYDESDALALAFCLSLDK
jgi:crossover junction endodeoxyribonuclease RuvC